MRVELVDERDTEWEDTEPVLRAFFWTAATAVACVDVRDATTAEAMEWARAEAARRGARLELAIRALDSSGRPGLIWLIGDGGGSPRG